MEEYILWLEDWFKQKGELPENVNENNYFDLGLIDSFGVIELIDDLEKHFSIKFTELHFQERRFQTINGLAAMIQELKKA